MTRHGRQTRTGRPYRRARAHIIATRHNCWICGKPVNKQAKWPHPDSPTIDHNPPLSKGGQLTNPQHMQLAHAHCNLSRNNRPHDTPNGQRNTAHPL